MVYQLFLLLLYYKIKNMIYIIIYLILAIIWAIYCSHRTYKMGRLGKKSYNIISTFILNLLLFPYSIYYAISNKKF